MIGWDFGSLISEGNLMGCKNYLNLSTNNLNKFSAPFQSALFSSAVLQVTDVGNSEIAHVLLYPQLILGGMFWN